MWWDIVKVILIVAGTGFIPAAITIVFAGEKLGARFMARVIRQAAAAPSTVKVLAAAGSEQQGGGEGRG